MSTTQQETPDKFAKLPLLARPLVYNLELSPCLQSFECKGKALIDLKILEKTHFLKLHANELDIKRASIKLANGTELTDLKTELDKKWTLLTVRFPKELEPQDAQLSFDFVGELNTKMQGFSRSTYKDPQGNEKVLASTQFESTYARTAFPCWDEPTYKAKFNVALEVDAPLTALSNMNVIGEERSPSAGKKLVRYATTPLMSTYLLAFAVGDFEYIETRTAKKGVPVRVYTVPGKKEQAQYALEKAAKYLEYHEDWFGVDSPLPKCDLIAIPDFCMGAMENWGLVTYREICLLVDPKNSSTLQKTHVAMVIAHELGHFWFGNLVTMKWWTDLWLKEGFASFMEYVCVDAHHPELKIWLQFLTDEVASGMALDGLRSSHPIEVEINNPNELDEIYDAITYAKSNSINRMLFDYLGEPTFQRGLRSYLRKYQFSNAQTTDLWQALGDASGQDIDSLMSSWTKQMGYPLVTVARSKDAQGKCVLKLKQTRFISDGGEDELGSVWQVPIGVITASSPDPAAPKCKILLTKAEEHFVLDGVGDGDWLKLNAGVSGFFRVHYSDEMFRALLPDVASKRLHIADRFNVANDLFALVESGRAPATLFLDYLKASAGEDEYIVWNALHGGISCLANAFEHSGDAQLQSNFRAFITRILEPIAEPLGWQPQPDEDIHKSLLRSLTMGRLAKCGHKPTVEKALDIFGRHTTAGADVVPDLRTMIYGVAAREKPAVAIEALKRIQREDKFTEFVRSAITAMAQCPTTEGLAGVYDYAILQQGIRPQDYMSLFVGSQVHKVGQDFSWAFFKQNVEHLKRTFGSVNSAIFQRCLKYSAGSHCSEEAAKDVEDFCKSSFDPHSLKVLERPIKQVTESIRLNAQLLEKNIGPVRAYLQKEGL